MRAARERVVARGGGHSPRLDRSGRVRLSASGWAPRQEALIRKPWMQADAVARAVGYSDASAFSRAFKRYAGINWRQLKRLAFENPDIAAALITIPFLDHAYALAMFAKKNPSAISMLQRLADCLHESSVRPS